MDQEQMQVLREPFPLSAHFFKPGATTKDKSKALGLTYVDSRQYQARLDAVDPDWSVEYMPNFVEGRILVNCRLTVLGITREDVGECALADTNAYTSAVAQAFKRTCAQFGLGRYLYDVPRTWAEYDSGKRRFSSKGETLLQSKLATAIKSANGNGRNGSDGGDTGKKEESLQEPRASAPGTNGNGKKIPAVSGKATLRARTRVLDFGLHKGKKLGGVFDTDRQYVQRIAEGKIRDEALTSEDRMAARYLMQIPASNGNGKAKSNGNLTLDEALRVVVPFGTRNHPEYKGKTLREIEAVEAKFVTWLGNNAKDDDLRRAANVVIESRG